MQAIFYPRLFISISHIQFSFSLCRFSRTKCPDIIVDIVDDEELEMSILTLVESSTDVSVRFSAKQFELFERENRFLWEVHDSENLYLNHPEMNSVGEDQVALLLE